MAELQPCDPEIYKNGDLVGIFAANIGAEAFERVVQGVTTILNTDLDWHFAAGRAVVKCHPDEGDGAAALIEAVLVVLGNYKYRSTAHDGQ